jgi:hypothetical protein
MKKTLILAYALSLGYAAWPQGTVIFSNRAGSSSTAAPGAVYAPIYREDPTDPTHRISGNTPTGIPGGTVSYNGAGFVASGQGPTFIATLWALNAPVIGDAANNNLQQVLVNGTAPFRTSTSGSFAGIWVQPTDPAAIPRATQVSDRPAFQIRVWDTRGGAIATWDQLMLPENNEVLRGYSELFTIPFPLGDTLAPPGAPPCLQGLQSFNLFIVPEPSVLVLGFFAAAFLVLFRRRKERNRFSVSKRPLVSSCCETTRIFLRSLTRSATPLFYRLLRTCRADHRPEAEQWRGAKRHIYGSAVPSLGG